MYVWFHALTNYISALGWPENEEKFHEFWGTSKNPNAIQVAGKDNLRQQTAMWQAMLMAANLPPTRQIFIHGFITSGGQKMSKSLGNVIDPFEYVEKYGTDALRYYLLAKISPTEDSDFTKQKFEEVYNADLANGLGNLVARVAAMMQKDAFKTPSEKPLTFSKEIIEAVKKASRSWSARCVSRRTSSARSGSGSPSGASPRSSRPQPRLRSRGAGRTSSTPAACWPPRA